MKKTTKIILVASTLFLAITLASATLMSSHGSIQTNLTVHPTILIDGNSWSEPIVHNLDGYGGDVFMFTHTITNNCPRTVLLEWEHTGMDLDGIDISLAVDGIPLGLQFTLAPEESLKIDFTFALHDMIQENVYEVKSGLNPGFV